MKKNITTGYTYLVKIAEFGLQGDKERVKRYVDRYIAMFPETDLTWAFNNILNNDLNPDKLTKL